jgi:hypothetical protein
MSPFLSQPTPCESVKSPVAKRPSTGNPTKKLAVQRTSANSHGSGLGDEARITAKMKRTEELKAIRKNSDLYRDAMNRYYCKSRRGTTELSICGCGDGFQHNRSFGDGTKIPKPSLNDFPLYLFEDDEELRAERQAEYEERQEAKKRRMRKREEKAAALRKKYPAEEVKPDVPALKANLIVDGKSLYHFEIVEEKNFVGRSTMNVR